MEIGCHRLRIAEGQLVDQFVEAGSPGVGSPRKKTPSRRAELFAQIVAAATSDTETPIPDFGKITGPEQQAFRACR
jgi:hypothetical protein